MTIEWFVGLGTGGQPEQFAAQEDVVERFNSSQDDIKVELTIYDPDLAYDEFRRRIDAGDPPDIVGPIGIRGANEFSDEFLDLSPFIDEETLADYDPEQVAVFEEDCKLTALPFGVFPSMMFYNRDVFDQAGLP
ncbi:MAG: extracellular solute-binding protein, partial [Ilumatobacteraceae bacterium]